MEHSAHPGYTVQPGQSAQPGLSSRLGHGEYIDAAEAELDTIVALVEVGPHDARVPTCPDYDLFGLARHVGQVCGFWIHLFADADRRPEPELVEGDEGDECDEPAQQAEWLAGRARHLIAELRATPAMSPCWTFDPDDHTAGFVARRVAHEFSIHRVDAQLAVGPANPISADLARDGIDELFLLAGLAPVPDAPGAGSTIHLHSTDADGEWLVALGAAGLEVTHEHAKGDLAIRAAVSDLVLLLNSRPALGAVEYFGDEQLVEALRTRLVQ